MMVCLRFDPFFSPRPHPTITLICRTPAAETWRCPIILRPSNGRCRRRVQCQQKRSATAWDPPVPILYLDPPAHHRLLPQKKPKWTSRKDRSVRKKRGKGKYSFTCLFLAVSLTPSTPNNQLT